MSGIRHLYVHVPFCRRRCPYCDYSVYPEVPPTLEDWIEPIGRELRLRDAEGVSVSRLETILVGGGTPSTLGAALAPALVGLLRRERLSDLKEWTVEANPEDLTSDLLDVWARTGVTRVHLGVQTLNDSALEWLGRLHSASEARAAIGRLATSGLRSWGVDVLFGLPNEVDPDPAQSLEELIEDGAPHVSLYELTPEPGTVLHERVESGEVRLADEEERSDQYLKLCETLGSAGYEAYEMTAFALPGHRSRHMSAVLEGRSWIGLGPGAHSKIEDRRVWNLGDWQGYLTAVAEGRVPEVTRDIEPSMSEAPERFWFALRRADGISRAELGPRAIEVAERWRREGMAMNDRNRVCLTPRGWLKLDTLSAELARADAQVEPPEPGHGMAH